MENNDQLFGQPNKFKNWNENKREIKSILNISVLVSFFASQTIWLHFTHCNNEEFGLEDFYIPFPLQCFWFCASIFPS